jgi:hypothetical protein
MTTELYNDLLQYASGLIRKKECINIEPGDAVNDAYLLNPTATKQQLKNKILWLIVGEKNHQNTMAPITAIGKPDEFIKENHQCNKCREVLPASEFYVERRKGKPDRLFNQCKECISKHVTPLREQKSPRRGKILPYQVERKKNYVYKRGPYKRCRINQEIQSQIREIKLDGQEYQNPIRTKLGKTG